MSGDDSIDLKPNEVYGVGKRIITSHNQAYEQVQL